MMRGLSGVQESNITAPPRADIQREESYKLRLKAPIFLRARSHQSQAKERRPTRLVTSPPPGHRRLPVFSPFQFVIKARSPSSRPRCGHHALHQQLPASEQDTHYLFITPSLEGAGAPINTASLRRPECVPSAKSHTHFGNNKHGTPRFIFECM